MCAAIRAKKTPLILGRGLLGEGARFGHPPFMRLTKRGLGHGDATKVENPEISFATQHGGAWYRVSRRWQPRDLTVAADLRSVGVSLCETPRLSNGSDCAPIARGGDDDARSKLRYAEVGGGQKMPFGVVSQFLEASLDLLAVVLEHGAEKPRTFSIMTARGRVTSTRSKAAGNRLRSSRKPRRRDLINPNVMCSSVSRHPACRI